MPLPKTSPARPAPLAPSVWARAPRRAPPPALPLAGLLPCAELVPQRGHRSPYPTPPGLGRAGAGARATTLAAAAHRAAPADEYTPDPSSRPSGHWVVGGARRAPVPADPRRYDRP